MPEGEAGPGDPWEIFCRLGACTVAMVAVQDRFASLYVFEMAVRTIGLFRKGSWWHSRADEVGVSGVVYVMGRW